MLFEVRSCVSSTDSPEDGALFDPQIREFNWPLATLGGILSFVVGYVLMAAVILVPDGPKSDASLSDIVFEIGTTYYNAHNIVLNVDKVDETVQLVGSGPVNRLVGETAKPALLYYAVPVVALLLVSGVVAYYTVARDAPIEMALLPAVGITLGYTVFAVVATLFVRDSLGGGAVLLIPDLTQTLLYGLIYSLVCGSLASLIAVGYRDRAELRRRFG